LSIVVVVIVVVIVVVFVVAFIGVVVGVRNVALVASHTVGIVHASLVRCIRASQFATFLAAKKNKTKTNKQKKNEKRKTILIQI
jgi:uncharacterized protein YqfA (UPF0365 family)